MTEDVTAVEMVDQAHRQLDSVSSRFSFVEALHDELEKRTLGKPFIARNACMWEAMLSARDMAVVHFGQWVVTTHNQGLMKQLDRCSLRGFYVPGQLSKSARDTGEVVNLGDPADGDTLRESIRQHKHAGLLKLYHSMFPSAAIGDREPNRSDVDDLRECFWTELECVKDDRNNC